MPTTHEREVFSRINDEITDPLDRLTAKIAFIDAAHGLPADDLRALGIDRADLRWNAVRGYLQRQREDATFALNRTLILIFAVGMASQSATARGAAGWVGRLDVLDAIARIKRSFGPRAAEIIAEEFIPASLREQT